MKREFTGVWIPAKIWTDKNLTITEKFLLAEVSALDTSGAGCWANNRHFSESLGCTPSAVSHHLKSLIEKGYLRAQYDSALTMTGRKIFLQNYYPQQEVAPIEENSIPLSKTQGGLSKTKGGLSKTQGPLRKTQTERTIKDNTNTIESNTAEFLQNSSEGFTKKLESLLIEAGATFVDSPNYEAPQTKKSTPAPRPKKTAAVSPEAAAAFAHFSDAAKIAESWGAWMRYKVSQFGAKGWYASPESELTAIRKLYRDTNGDANKAAEIINQSISNTWKGLFEIKNISNNGKSESAARQIIDPNKFTGGLVKRGT